jgi:aminopeptidase N
LEHQQENKWLLAEQLTLPSEHYLADQMAVVDVDAIHAAREFLLGEIATAAADLLLTTYAQNSDHDAYAFTMPAVGRRQLKNRCLAYLMKLNDPSRVVAMAEQQFAESLSRNMTDTMGALRALVEVEGPEREAALGAFYEKWQRNALVVDKWFALQAGSGLPQAFSDVKDLMRHPAFDLKNPNKVYALIGAFGRNQAQFHAGHGETYPWLANIVQELDALNAQVAARMIQPLIQWRRYDKKRQALMRQQLELIIKNTKLSGDVYELVSKSLAE